MGASRRLPLTIIVPAYGRQASLDRALLSIAHQSVRPAKVIVVDDGSPQALTAGAACRGRLDLQLVRHPENRGAAAARNTGLRAAETEWIGFLDSDDLLLKDSLEARWAMLAPRLEESTAERTIFGCGWVDFSAPDRLLGIRHPRPGRSLRDFASGCWFSPGSCVIMNGRAAVEAAGFQDETLARFEDVDWFYALARQNFAFESLPLVAVAIERSRGNRPARMEAAAAALLRKWQGEPPALLRRLRSYMDLETAAAHYYAGSTLKAALRVMRSVATVPRLALQLSPGWDREKPDPDAMPDLSWFAHPQP